MSFYRNQIYPLIVTVLGNRVLSASVRDLR